MISTVKNSRVDVTVVPFEGVSGRAVSDLIRDLEFLPIEFAVAPRAALPMAAYEPRRRQYRADMLLGQVQGYAGGKVLGVCDCDLYIPPLNFVFGLAELPGTAALISLHRLNGDGDARLLRERAVKEAVHELGHTMGLPHCADPGCVMFFSHTLADTDRKPWTICSACRRLWPNGPVAAAGLHA